MSKKKSTSQNAKIAIIAIILGVVIIAITPLIRFLTGQLLTVNCPMIGSVRECGLELGYKYAFYTDTITSLWLIAGVIILVFGIVKYFIKNKKHQ